jgi:hypothetical protein
MKNLRVALLLLFMASAFASTVSAQKKNKKMMRDSVQAVAIERLVASNKYIFTAEYTSAAQGGTVELNSYYYLEVTPDLVTTNLPYYGDSYTSGGLHDSGIKLSTKNFDYLANRGAAGHLYVSIKPKDSSTEQELVLDVAPDGKAGLIVYNIGRGRMIYSGTIGEKEESK